MSLAKKSLGDEKGECEGRKDGFLREAATFPFPFLASFFSSFFGDGSGFLLFFFCFILFLVLLAWVVFRLRFVIIFSAIFSSRFPISCNFPCFIHSTFYFFHRVGNISKANGGFIYSELKSRKCKLIFLFGFLSTARSKEVQV